MARLIPLLLAALALAVACGDDGDGAVSTTTDAPTTTAATSTEPEPVCSASGAGPVADQPGLPEPVADLRRDIVDAALACDYERLQALALEGEGSFTYSFGAEGDPAAHWREQEGSSAGPQPLRFLVGLLDAPHRTIDVPDGPEQYVWPSAFAYDSWQEVPDDDKNALEPLYTEEDFEGFERFGGYAGYRVGITADGDWIFFVAGD